MKLKSRQVITHSDSYQERMDERAKNKDPLAHLNKTQTRKLEEFFMLSAEDNNTFFSHT